MQKIIFVGMGGFIGSSLRYLISLGASKWFNSGIPIGTLIVNILGGILIGAIMEASNKYTSITPELRLFLTTGILGGLTTFSTFSYETVNLLVQKSYLLGVLNAFLNLGLSLVGVFIGKLIIR